MRALFTSLCLLIIISAPTGTYGQTADPSSITVFSVVDPITVDGQLNEVSWNVPAHHLKFRLGATPSGYSNTPTNFVVVKPPYTDTSTCYVRFIKDGTNLYISLESDDKQVCRFDWEGDGLFMKIKNSADAAIEYKIYVGAAATFVYEGPGDGSGVGLGKAGTTIYDSTNVDNGYTAELKIDLAGLGFTNATTSVQVMLCIFDPDGYSLGDAPWGIHGNYAKQWWGSEWGDVFRTLQLSSNVVPVELTSFTASVIGNEAKLAWSTATETNNNGFEIQRSINNAEFEQIGFVKGSGTSTTARNYSFVDRNLVPDNKYSYRLKQIDLNGNFIFTQAIELGDIAPAEFAMKQNYPNPFNPSTKISFSLPVKSNVTLDIYNLLGQKVLSLVNSNLNAGNHDIQLDASRLNSGVYIYSLSAEGENGSNFTSSKKMTLIK